MRFQDLFSKSIYQMARKLSNILLSSIKNVICLFSPEFPTGWGSWRAPFSPARPRTGSSRTPAPASEAGSEKKPSGSALVSEKAAKIPGSWDLVEKEHIKCFTKYTTIAFIWLVFVFWWRLYESAAITVGRRALVCSARCRERQRC